MLSTESYHKIKRQNPLMIFDIFEEVHTSSVYLFPLPSLFSVLLVI
uniref:Uncharacterized protein n=1 Tax=Arundo donax TaxID=35708 RepID=A0A0A9A3U5_ARUDO